MRLNIEAWNRVGASKQVPVMASSSSRSDIDTLRGLACILLVSFHVVGYPETGLRLPSSHWLSQFNDLLSYLRMPLFSFISGYVYAARPFAGDARQFIRGKSRRLLLPLLTMGTLYALVQRLTPGTNSSGVEHWWLLHIVPVGHFWFLESLFLIFLMIVVLERSTLLSRPESYLLVFGVCAALFVFAKPPVYFGLAGVVYLLPFFMGGLACRRFDIRSKRARWMAAALFAGATAWLATRPSQTAAAVFAGLIVSLCIVFLLLRSGWQVRWLAYVGSFSFAIYLMHVFFTAASRLLFSAIGLSDPYVHTLLGTAAGVLGPMAVASLIGRSPRLNLYLLGQSSNASTRMSAASSSR